MNDINPLVSIVLPCYNRAKYISSALESILNQTYDNFEVIIVDGHSTDGTLEIINNYVSKNIRIKLLFDNGTGIGPASNLGCNACKGEYIARMDSDDISLPQRIEEEVKFLINHPDYVLVSSAMEYMDEDGNYIGRNFVCTKDRVIRGVLQKRNVIAHPFVMFRRDAYLKTGGYPNVKIAEDILFYSRLARIGKFCNLPMALGRYRLGGDTLQRAYNPYLDVLISFRIKMMCDSNIDQEDIDLYNRIYTISKKYQVSSGKRFSERNQSMPEKLYGIIKPICGRKRAEMFVSSLLNFYFSLVVKGIPLKTSRY